MSVIGSKLNRIFLSLWMDNSVIGVRGAGRHLIWGISHWDLPIYFVHNHTILKSQDQPLIDHEI